MSVRRILFCAAILLLWVNGASAARYQRCKDGKTLVWNSLRGVAQDVSWSGLHDLNGYATGEGTLTWYRLGAFVNSYTGKMVRGKFEGPVIRLQGNTRLQASFANGEKVSGWSEPGSSPTAVQTPAPNEQAESPEETPVESPTPPSLPTPTPRPRPSPTATATPIPKPTPSPTPTPESSPTPTATLSPSPTPTPLFISPTPTPTPTPRAASMSTPMGMPTLLPTATPTPLRVFSPSLPEQSASPSGPVVEAPVGTLESARSPEPQMQTEQLPSPTGSPLPKTTPTTSAPGGSRKIDPVAKRQLIVQFKQQIDFVLGQVSDATDNFRQVERLDQVRGLPSSVSSHVTLLANSARDFRARLGYEVTFYECLSEMQAVDSLVVVDESARDIAAKDAPIARKALVTLRSRYTEPSAEAQKPLWRYLVALYSLCDRMKTEAEGHLPRARAFESAGKKADALREYREINRLYPNKITTERIRLLESQSR